MGDLDNAIGDIEDILQRNGYLLRGTDLTHDGSDGMVLQYESPLGVRFVLTVTPQRE